MSLLKIMTVFGLIAVALGRVSQVTDQTQINLILKMHNDERAKNNLPPMKWNSKLASFAANKVLPLSCNSGTMTHSKNSGYGENLAANSRSDRTTLIETGIKGWIDEIQWYNYGANTCSAPPGKACGHYTQVVWDVSTKVGCAIATGCRGSYGNFFGCNYEKAGNMCNWKPYGRSKSEMCNCDGSSLCDADGLFADPYNTTPCRSGSETKKEGSLSVTRTISCQGGCRIQYQWSKSGRSGSGSFSAPAKAGQSVKCPNPYLDWCHTMNKAKKASGGSTTTCKESSGPTAPPSGGGGSPGGGVPPPPSGGGGVPPPTSGGGGGGFPPPPPPPPSGGGQPGGGGGGFPGGDIWGNMGGDGFPSFPDFPSFPSFPGFPSPGGGGNVFEMPDFGDFPGFHDDGGADVFGEIDQMFENLHNHHHHHH